MRKGYLLSGVLILLMMSTLYGPSARVYGQKTGKQKTGSSLYNIMAGLAQVDITPPAGYSHYRGVSTGVHDRLYAKAIVVGEGEQRFAIVICDLLYMDRPTTTRARTQASHQTGIPYSNIMIAATHNHTGPSYNSYIDELNRSLRPSSYVAPKTENGMDYPEWLTGQIANAIAEANNKAAWVTMESGITYVDNLAFNRRWILKDGTVRMNPGVGNPDNLSPAGPVDSSLGILLLRRVSDNKPIGCLSNFGLHADTFGGTEFSADFPGFLAEALTAEFGPGFISIFANGPCGDINHVDAGGGADKPRISSAAISEKLASAIKNQLSQLQKIKNTQISSGAEMVYVPIQSYSDRELKWALSMNGSDSLLNENPYAQYRETPFLTIRRGVKIRHLYQMRRSGEAIPPTIGKEPWYLPLEVQVFSIGKDFTVVGLPGEVFTGLSLAIKASSPFKSTLVIECTNTLLPYVPTEKAFTQGGYETINSRLIPGGGEILVETAINLLQKSGAAN